MSGKIIACAPILNEEDYIWYVMESIYDVVDKIVLIEGADDYSRRYSEKGLSVDRTGEIIQEFKSQRDSAANKIIHVKAGRVSTRDNVSRHKYQSQYYAEHFEPGDLRLLISGDEIFDPIHVYRSAQYLRKHPKVWFVEFEHLMFWKSFHQLLCVKDIRDFQPRMMVWQEGLHFIDNNTLLMKDDSPYGFKAEWCRDFIDEFKIWHMGWVREREKFIEKRVWTLNKARKMNEKRLDYLKSLDEEDIRLEAEFQGKMFTNHLAINEYVKKYEGPWPQVLLSHPWFDRSPEEFLR